MIIGTVAPTGFWSAPPLRLARSTSDPCGLQNFCYQFSQHWTHIFSLKKKSKTQLTTDHLNFQSSLIVSKNRKIETFTGRSHRFTTIPTVRSFFRQHLPWQRAWLADAKAPVSERPEVWGRFHSFGAPQTIPNLMFVGGSGWARAFLLTEIRGELRFFWCIFLHVCHVSGWGGVEQ